MPSAKTFANGGKTGSSIEMSMIKWSHLNSEKSNTKFAFLSAISRHDCGCVHINDTGLYLISFIQFLGVATSKKKPCIQLQIDGSPVLSTISDKTAHLIFHDDT